VILTLPKSFANGGYLVSPLLMMISAVVTTKCICNLIDTSLKFKLYSYSLVVDKVFGRQGRNALDLMIFLTQTSFSISIAVFIIRSLTTSVNQVLSLDTPMWYYALGLLSILTPISWVRDIKKFSFSFLVGNLVLSLLILTVIVNALSEVMDRGFADDLKMFNE
jgi:amino acid permease